MMSFKSTSTSTGLGSLILQGLGAQSTISSRLTSSTSLGSPAYTNTTISYANSSFDASTTSQLKSNFSTPPTFTLPSTGSGSIYASECNSEWSEYSSYAGANWQSRTILSTFTTTEYTATIKTLCDGQPHAIGSLTSLATTTSVLSAPKMVSYTGPQPSCTIDASDCIAPKDSYTSSLNDYSTCTAARVITVSLDPEATLLVVENSIIGTNSTTIATAPVTSPPPITFNDTIYTADDGTTYTLRDPTPFTKLLSPGGSAIVFGYCGVTHPEQPACSTNRPSTNVTQQCGQCTIAGGTVQLLYFPVTTSAARSSCASALPLTDGTVCPFGTTVQDTAISTNPLARLDDACSYVSLPAENATQSGSIYLCLVQNCLIADSDESQGPTLSRPARPSTRTGLTSPLLQHTPLIHVARSERRTSTNYLPFSLPMCTRFADITMVKTDILSTSLT